jgi:hypothetical protein
MSVNHSSLGQVAVNWRWTRSSLAGPAAKIGGVVLWQLAPVYQGQIVLWVVHFLGYRSKKVLVAGLRRSKIAPASRIWRRRAPVGCRTSTVPNLDSRVFYPSDR